MNRDDATEGPAKAESRPTLERPAKAESRPTLDGGGAGGRQDPPVVCRKLRTKVAFGALQPGRRDWRYGESTTAVYWCLATMETGGPDDGFAHPHRCCAGRACYVPPPEAEEPAGTEPIA